MYRFTDITVLVRKGVVFTEGVDAGFRKAYLCSSKAYARRRMTLNSSRDLNSASPSTHYISATKNVCISHEVVLLLLS